MKKMTMRCSKPSAVSHLPPEVEQEMLAELRSMPRPFDGLEDEAYEDGDDDTRPRTSFGISLLEQLLLGIIRAHPQDRAGRDRIRLDAAMKALVGNRSTNWPLPGDTELAALLWMDSQLLQRRYNAGLTRKKALSSKTLEKAAIATFSAKKLAEDAAKEFYKPCEFENVSYKLRQMFTGVYQKKLKSRTAKRPDFGSMIRYINREHDYIAETCDSQDLRKIAGLLQHCVAINTDLYEKSRKTTPRKRRPEVRLPGMLNPRKTKQRKSAPA